MTGGKRTIEPEQAQFVEEELARIFQIWLFRAVAFGALLFVLFGLLDRVAAPEHAWVFLWYRVTAAAVLLALAVLSRRTRRLPLLAAMAYGAVLVSAISLELMILRFGGHQSIYYAGLLVLGVCAVSFIPAPLAFHLPLAAMIWLVYLVPILALERLTNMPVFFASNFFMVSILATVLTMRFYSHRTLTREIALRYDFHRHQRNLEDLVAQRTAELSHAVDGLREEIAGRGQIEAALKQASDDWRVTFDSTQDLIVMTDAGGKIVKVNRSTTRFFDRSFAEILGQECAVLFREFRSPAESNPLGAGVASRHEEAEAFLPQRDLWLSVTADPLGDGDGEPRGAVFILRDISAHKKAETEKRELENTLVQMQKMDSIGRLAGGIAHDFNNMLSAILGYGEVALFKIPEDHPARESLRVVLDSAERAATLTQQLLAFSRKQVLAMKAVNLNEVVEQMARMLFRVIKENVKIELRTEQPVGNILADKSQIEQVILNLIVNARDAMPGGGRLTVETADITLSEDLGTDFRGVRSGPYVMLAVTDTGTGIPPEIKEKIFEPFFTTKEAGKGTGLGLATVYGIVRQHDGHLVVESEPGKGSTFRAYFPRTELHVQKQFSEKQAAALRGTERVLVVEDNRLLRFMVRDALQPLGYQVLLAADAAEALRITDTGPEQIDLLLTDFVLPGRNGWELAEAFKARRPEAKVVIMSGHIDDGAEQERLQNSGIPFIQKPLVPSKFIRVLRDVLDGRIDNPETAAGAPGAVRA